MNYIFSPTETAQEAGLIRAERRKSVDGQKVILLEQDFDNYNPLITVIETSTDEEGETVETSYERYAATLEEKAAVIGAVIMTVDQARKEVEKPEWAGVMETK